MQLTCMHRLKLLLTTFILVVVSFEVLAQKTLIQGNAFYYRGKMIEVRAYTDLFTFQSSVLSRMLIPQDGSFKFELDIEEEGLYLINIERVNAHLFIKPGDQYTLVLTEPAPIDRYEPAKDVFILPEVFEAQGQLNYDITELEKTLNQFLLDNAKYYGRSVHRKLIPISDSMAEATVEKYANRTDSYFKTHLHYRLAVFALQTNHSRKQVFEKYFSSRAPAYRHLSYANAFTMLFDEYFDYLNPKEAHRFQDEAESAIHTGNYWQLMESMERDPHLQDRATRELLAATQLYELGTERKYPLSKILVLLDSLLMNAQDKECQIVAANAQEALNYLAPGTLCPDFEFTDLVGNINRLSEYRGRYIYLQFFDDFDAETLKEMSLMKVLKEGYGTEVAMFSISTEENIRKIKSIAEEYDFEWYFGKALSPREVVQSYELRSFPSYFYIDKNLKFLNSPAPPPGAKIEKLFAKSWNSEHPNKSLRFKLQPPEITDEPIIAPPR